MSRKTVFFLLFCFFLMIVNIYPYNNFGNINVSPKKINSGDTVSIKYKYNRVDEIKVITPSGKIYNLNPALSGLKNEIKFFNTNYKGFLKTNWNKYTVKFFQNKKCIDSAFFSIWKKNKTLFFTIYIDDIGRDGFLFEEGEKWFKSIGGVLNYGYQNDDEGGMPLKPVMNRYNNEFIFHHYTAAEFGGNRILWSIYHFVKWEFIKLDINNFLNINLRDRHYISIALIFLIISSILFFKLRIKLRIYLLAFSIIFLSCIVLIIFSEKHVQDENKWVFRFEDRRWNEKSLKEFKALFNEENLDYPPITRHTWNIPPYGMNRFYLCEMGVLADASIIFNNPNKYQNIKKGGIILQKIKKYAYKMPEKISLPVPYYTNINDELNTVWDGVEENRGLLEMPLTIDDISAFPIDDFDKAIFDSLPNGALISTYIHPKSDLRSAKDLINYLNDNYKIVYISALDYVGHYLKNFPRPIIFNYTSKKSYWAYLGEDNIIPITQTDVVSYNERDNDLEINTYQISADDDSDLKITSAVGSNNQDNYSNEDKICELEIKTYKMPPYIGIKGDEFNEVNLDSSYVLDRILEDNIKIYKYSVL